MFTIIVLALAAFSTAVPTYSNASTAVSNLTDTVAACGTPNEFFIHGLWSWVPTINSTHPPHFYMELHDIDNNLHTRCFDDPPYGRTFSQEYVKCVDDRVEFRWDQKISCPGCDMVRTYLIIRETFAPCNPWFKTATIEAKIHDLNVLTWPDDRWGQGNYLRTPAGEFRGYFDQRTIDTGGPKKEGPANGIWR